MIDITVRPRRLELDDWRNLGVLGEGGFGTVCLYQQASSGRQIALKKMKKRQIIDTKQVDHIKSEIHILNAAKHPYIVSMEGISQNPKFIMIGMEYVRGGEFFNYLRKVGRLNMAQTVYYSAQVALMLEYLHQNQVVYRDLKPENLIIDHEGLLKLTDFGFAKKIQGRTYTFCGTTEYLAPEIVLNKGHSFPVDWWALGILIFEMLVGVDPFNAPDPMTVMDNIAKNRLKIPAHVPTPARSLIERLLEPDLDKRFGNLQNGAADVRNHQFFDSIDWNLLQSRSIPAAYKPPRDSSETMTPYNTSSEMNVPALQSSADPFADW